MSDISTIPLVADNQVLDIKSKPKVRLDYIDALRGIAILMVIITHANSLVGLTGKVGWTFGILAFGVQLFFVVSGFTIYLTFASSLERAYAHPVREFFIRRLARIVPVYWSGIILYSLVYGYASRGWLPGPETWHYPLHVLLLNIWHPAAQSSVVPGGWSISLEVMFYLAFPFFALWIKTLQGALRFLLVTVVGLPAIGFLIKPLILGWFDPNLELNEMWWSRLPFNQFGCFAFGILLYFLTVQNVFPQLRRVWVNLATMLLSLVLGILAAIQPFSFPLNVHIVALAFGLCALCLSYIPWQLIVNPFAIFMGKISYSAYLIHFLVLIKLFPFITADDIFVRFVLLVAAALPVTIALSYLSYRFIELPAIEMGRRLIKIQRATRPNFAG